MPICQRMYAAKIYYCRLQDTHGNGSRCNKMLSSPSGMRNHQRNTHQLAGPPYTYNYAIITAADLNNGVTPDTPTDNESQSDIESESFSDVSEPKQETLPSVKRSRSGNTINSNGESWFHPHAPPPSELPASHNTPPRPRVNSNQNDSNSAQEISAPNDSPGNNNAANRTPTHGTRSGLDGSFASVRNNLERLMNTAT